MVTPLSLLVLFFWWGLRLSILGWEGFSEWAECKFSRGRMGIASRRWSSNSSASSSTAVTTDLPFLLPWLLLVVLLTVDVAAARPGIGRCTLSGVTMVLGARDATASVAFCLFPLTRSGVHCCPEMNLPPPQTVTVTVHRVHSNWTGPGPYLPQRAVCLCRVSQNSRFSAPGSVICNPRAKLRLEGQGPACPSHPSCVADPAAYLALYCPMHSRQ